jgi:Na+/proline symporter/signal transduction histidine kinase
MGFNIDLIIFTGFLIVNLLVGIYYGRGVRSIKEYAVGDRNFSTGTMTATLVASYAGAGFFTSALAEVYRQGLYALPLIIGDAIALCIIGYVFAPRMGRFFGKISIAEAMYSMFGPKVRIITSVAGILSAIGIIGLQFKVSGKILQLIFGTDGTTATLISAAIIILYSAFGGIKAVTFTDIIQFFTFGCIIPIVLSVTWQGVNNHQAVLDTLKMNPNFDFSVIFDFGNVKFYHMLSLFVVYLIPCFSPLVFQRVLMSRNTAQVARAFKNTGLVVLLMKLLVFGIAITVLTDRPDLNPDNLLMHLVGHYSAPGFKGILAICLMAMIMSTADSLLNAISVIFAHDICKPTGFKWAQNELVVSKAFTVVAGVSGIYFSMKFQTLLQIAVSAWSFYIPVVSIPFICSVFGFRTSEKSVLIGMAAGVSAVILFQHTLNWNTQVAFVIAVSANLCALFASHYLLKQGKFFDTADFEDLTVATKSSSAKDFINAILQFRFVEFCRSNTPKNEATYLYVGLFSILSVFTAIYALPDNLKEKSGFLINYLNNSTLFVASYFLTYTVWPRSFKNKSFAAISWIFGATYLLICAPGIFVLLSDFGHNQLTSFCINVVIMSLIFRWRVALVLMTLGIYLSIVFFQNFISSAYVASEDSNASFKIAYIILLFGSAIIAFLRPLQDSKEQAYKKVMESENELHELSQEMLGLMIVKQEFLNNIQHEIRTPIHHIGVGATALHKNWHQYSDKEKQSFASVIHEGYTRISDHMNNILDFSSLSVNKINLHYAEVNIVDLVHSVIDDYKKLYIEEEKIEFTVTSDAKTKIIECDPSKITQVLKHLLKNSIDYSLKGMVEIIISDASINSKDGSCQAIKVSVIDEGIGIPPEELHNIFGPFSQSSYTKKSSGGKGLGLALAEKIVQMHGGNIWALNNSDKPGAVISFVVPKSKANLS